MTAPLKLDRLQARDVYFKDGKPTLQMQLFWQTNAAAIEAAFNGNAALDEAQQAIIDQLASVLSVAQGASNDLGTTTDFIRTRDSAVDGVTLDADTSSITISTHDRQYLDPSVTVSVTGDTITGLTPSTTYFVHYTDPDYSGGTVGFQVATALIDAVPTPTEPYRHYVGTIEVPAAGTATGTAALDPYWKVTSVGGGGTTTNAVTFDDTGGAAAGTTFDGSAARTIDYSTVGAAAATHDHDSDYLALTGGTLTGDLNVPDEAYDATNWNGSTEVPTKNAVRDKVESLAAPSRVLISEVVTTGSQSSVTFSSIAATYRDIEIVIRGRGTAAATSTTLTLTFNGSASGHDSVWMQANGSAVQTFNNGLNSGGAYIGDMAAASATAGVADHSRAIIYDYRGTTFQKAGEWTCSLKTNTTSTNQSTRRGSLWFRSTSAINQVAVAVGSGGFVDGSVVSLYGLM